MDIELRYVVGGDGIESCIEDACTSSGAAGVNFEGDRDAAVMAVSMTTQQLHLLNLFYLAVFCVTAVLTRATLPRIAGAVAGGALAATIALPSIALGEHLGLWHMAILWQPYFLTLLWIDFALGGFVFLITWRIARRFGAAGLTVLLVLAVIFGPMRDYGWMAHFPEWGSDAPGVGPKLAISAAYVLMGVAGHGCMRMIAGRPFADRLARPAWKSA